MALEDFDRIAARIEGMTDEVIALEKRLTAIPAISPESGGEGEMEKAESVMDYLDAIGVRDVRRLDSDDPQAKGGRRPNIIARIPGRDGTRTVWVMSHLDVVPPGDEEKWSSPPWEARVEGDRIYGRGVEDNQQGIVTSLILAKALLEEGVRPHHDLAFLFVADEEVGSKHGIQHVLETDNPFSPDDLVIVPDGGEPDGSMIEVAEKTILWTRFEVVGRMTHASTPERGVNAFRAAARLVGLLEGLHDDFPQSDEVFDPPISTFEPTKRLANVENVNTIPGEDVFFMDARILPGISVDEVKQRMRSLCEEVERARGVEVEMEHPMEQRAAPPTPVDSPVVKLLERAVARVYDVRARPMGIGGGTVAAYLRNAGIPSVVWARMDETLHGFDEYVIIPNVLGDAKVFCHVALDPDATGPSPR
jgi:succinyl-diaminopimelate desuccinylase